MAADESEEFEFRLRAEQESRAGGSPREPAKQTDDFATRSTNPGTAETALHVGSQMLAFPVEAISSIDAMLTAKPGTKMQKARENIQAVEDAMVYQPRSESGKLGANVTDKVLSAPGRFVDYLTGGIAENPTVRGALGAQGAEYLQAGANVAGQALPAVFGPKIVKAATGRVAAAGGQSAARAAEAYVANRTSLDWNSLSADFKQKLTAIAQDAKNLESLDPKAVERQARLGKLGVPATRGEITRNLPQLTTEETLRKSETGGRDLLNIQAEQDRVLHEHLDTLRRETGGKAESPIQVGSSVQGVLRQKLRNAKADAGKAYDLANSLGEKEVTTVEPLNEFLKDPINDANVGTDIRARLKAYSSADGKVSLKNLEDIRQELTRAAKNPNKGGHYASEAAKVIDGIMDNAGSSAYKNARAQWKALQDEFSKQGRIKKLVTEKGMSSDRATALEDTWNTVVRKGSAEDLQKVQKSLLTGDKRTAAAGRQAWNDLQAATIDWLKEKAAGKRLIKGEQGQLQFNSSFLEALDELDRDGKLDILYGKGTSAKLREIAEATRDVRTKPTGRVAGSDTASRMINFLDKLAMVPGGHYVAGVAKVAQKVRGFGEEARQTAQAKSTPLDEAARAARKRRGPVSQTLESLQDRAPVAPFTLQDTR